MNEDRRPNTPPKKNTESKWKALTIWVLIFAIALFSYQALKESQAAKSPQREISFSLLWKYIEEGKVAQIDLDGRKITGQFVDEVEGFTAFKSELPFDDPDFVKFAVEHGVIVNVKPHSMFKDVLISLLPWLALLGLLWLLMFRQFREHGQNVMQFTRSRAKLLQKEDNPGVTFKDVAGVEEAKEELREVIEFLKNQEKFRRLGARIPKGVLLVGPPGTGKTLLARAVAGEAGVPFISISGSDFVELFVGVGAARVRDLFAQARRNKPCIVFIDELDAVGRLRGFGVGGHEEREQTLNQLLVEMDGFDSSEGIIVLAATNRPDVLDPALLRPGRFDKRIVVGLPDLKGREEILKIHLKRIKKAKDVDPKKIARSTSGFSGADLANLVNEAALLAAKEGRDAVTMRDFEEALDKLVMGLARKSIVMSEEDKRLTAYHEAGHALVAKLLPDPDPIHKVTIIPRGMSLGSTAQMPLDDRLHYTKDYIERKLATLMGGRAAEKIALNTESVGAANDLERASQIARRMVTEWGMSERLGPISFGRYAEMTENPSAWPTQTMRPYSEETAKLIDDEIRRILRKAMERAERIIRENMDVLHEIVNRLLQKETITGDELDQIIREVKGIEPPDITVHTKKDEVDAGDSDDLGDEDGDRTESA